MSLKCTLVSQDGRIEHAFRPDEAKRSAFWLDDDLLLEEEETDEADIIDGPRRRREIAGPAECLVEAFSPSSSWPRADGESESGPAPPPPSPPARFCAGGFQLVSNARSVEVYLDDALLATCRGVPSPGHNGKCDGDGGDGAGTAAPRRYFRAVYVVPGGPRPVRKMTLRLRDLVPLGDGSGGPPGAAAVTARLVMMKVTARVLLEPADEEGGGASSSDGGNGASRAPASPPPALPHPPAAGPSEADVGSAMAALSLMIRSAEERIVQSTRACVQKQVEGGLEALRAEVRRVGDELGARLQWQSQALENQRRLIEAQQEQIRLLSAGQAELARIVAAAAAERSRSTAVEPSSPDGAPGGSGSCGPAPRRAADENAEGAILADERAEGQARGGTPPSQRRLSGEGGTGERGGDDGDGAAEPATDAAPDANRAAKRGEPAPAPAAPEPDGRANPTAPGAGVPAEEGPVAPSPPRDDPGEPPARVDIDDILLESFPIAEALGPCGPREANDEAAAAAASLGGLDLLLGGPRG